MVTHSELPPQYQIPQTMHVVAEFAAQHHEEYKQWYQSSNSVISLATKTEQELYQLKDKLESKRIKLVVFREPDIGGFITAIGLIPGPLNKKLLSNLPLAGKVLLDVELVTERLKQRKNIVYEMSQCYQDRENTQTILQHGHAVYQQLLKLINNPENLHGLKTLTTEQVCILRDKVLELDAWTVESYTVMHDMGKPFCKLGDSFPDHANKSFEYWNKISTNKTVGELIKNDMLFHTARTKEDIFDSGLTDNILATLALTALAELQSNAITLFGGFDSDSYKIKRKRLEKNIKLLLERL